MLLGTIGWYFKSVVVYFLGQSNNSNQIILKKVTYIKYM